MSTKDNPSRFDCYARALPDEPTFTLLGRDPLAAGLVHLWTSLRRHDWSGAITNLSHLAFVAMGFRVEREEKIKEALDCARSMTNWMTSNENESGWERKE